MPAEPQTAPPKIATPPSLAFFAGAVLMAAMLGSGAILFFFQSKHARILSGVPVSQADRSELSGLRRDAGGVSTVARPPLARAAGQRAVRSRARRLDGARGLVCRAQNLPSARHVGCAAKSVMGVPGNCRHFQRVAESACVFISLALKRAELFAFAAVRSRVQSVAYESDTSIDNNHV